MATQVTPFLSVKGPTGADISKQVAQTQQMLAGIDADVDPKAIVKGNWTFTFGPVGNLPGTSKPAFGFFRPKLHNLKIRFGMTNARNLTKQEVIYTESHEWLGHGWDHTTATVGQREQILAEMGLGYAIAAAENTGMTHDEAVMYVWERGPYTGPAKEVPYWERPYEAAMDMLVAALTSSPAVFERRYKWDINADALKAIILDFPVPVPGPTPTAPEPEPLPEPVDPCAELRTKITNAKSALGCKEENTDG